MTINDINRAKEIFFKYACNHFFLDREVDADEYKSYRVSGMQENKWRNEYIDYWINKISVEDLTALRCLDYTGAQKALPKMIALSDTGDSYAKFWFAYHIHSIAKWAFFSPVLRFRAIVQAKKLLQSIIQSPIEISEEHRKKIDLRMISALNAKTPEEYLLNYSKRKLKEISW